MRMTALVLAQMWDHDDHMGDGWGWLMGIGWILVVTLLVVLVVVLVRHDAPREGTGRSSAESLLSERFARGEIDEDEYRRRRRALRE